MLRFAVPAAWLLVTCASNAARASDLSSPAEALLVDLARIVDAEQSGGWFLDEEAQDEIRGTVFESSCRATPAARREALAELERRQQELGSARELFDAAGKTMTSEVEEALFIERQRTALAYAIERADEDCPFWVTPDQNFKGLQTDRHRLTLSLESGGNAQLRRTEGSWTVGGGGLARLLAGYGLGKVTLLGGIEFGGGAMLKPQTEPTQFVINYFPAIPLVVRLRGLAWHYDLEAAPVALFQADNGAFSYGGRAAFGLGLSALRTRGILPWAGATVAYEYYLPSGGREAMHFVRGGLRVGFMYDP